MKSRFFSAAFDDREASHAKTFQRHLRETLALSNEDRNACLDVLPEIRLRKTATETRRVIDGLERDCSVDRSKLENAVGVMDFLLRALLNDEVPDSDPMLWADDLEHELGWLEESTRPVFDAMLQRLQTDIAAKLEAEIRRRRAAGGVLPSLKSVGITVEVRAVRKDIFRWGTPIEAYQPQVIDTTTVASISIEVDEGTPRDLYFQADEDEIDYLISSLTAAKKDMKALRAYLSLDGTGKQQGANV